MTSPESAPTVRAGSRARLAGWLLLGIGLAVMAGFAITAGLNAGEFMRAKMLMDRNPGNSMYGLQFFIAATTEMALIAASAIGALMALNGGTLLVLGRTMARVESSARR